MGGVRKPRQQKRDNRMMDIDETSGSRPASRGPKTQDGAKRGGKAGGRGGSAARGGRGGRPKAVPVTRENLDMDLDSYMMRDATTAKTTLDTDLENYMLGTSDFPQQIGN